MSSAGDKRKRDAPHTGDVLDASAEAERKRREKKERLEAWRREQARKKAEQSGTQPAAKQPAAKPDAAKPDAAKPDAKPDAAVSKPHTSAPSRPVFKIALKTAPPPAAARAALSSFDEEAASARPPALDIRKAMSASRDEVPEEEEDPLEAYMSQLGKDAKHERTARGGEIIDTDDGILDEHTKPRDQIEMSTEAILALGEKRSKARELTQVDHSTIEYEPFRKDFYTMAQEIADMSDEQVDELRKSMDGITVRGRDCPRPITRWAHAALSVAVLDVIKDLGYSAPTPIQSQAIPAIMSGRDLIGVAKTGSGKTMAFLLPMFRHIKDQRPVLASEGPVALIMTPTRELALQIFKECRPFMRALGLRGACVYGGPPISDQISDMKKAVDFVVATPGRMIELLAANGGRVTNLQRLTYLVMDEADRMFDQGFEPQVMKIIGNTRPDRQTVLFSATFPRHMEALSRKVLYDRPLEIVVGGRSVVAGGIEQIVEVREEPTKFRRLLEILGQMFSRDPDARTLVFVERQESADSLLHELMKKGYPTLSLHGGKEQVDRDATIADFKAGVAQVLTATSVAARGLDVKQLRLVVNYDVPSHMEDYVHRAGRTGRAGTQGTCITFITPQQDRHAKDIISALQASNAAVPDALVELARGFAQKVSEGRAHGGSSGFGGRGLERLATDRERVLLIQQASFGDQLSEDQFGDKPKIALGIEVSVGAAPTDASDTKDASSGPLLIEHGSNSQRLEAARAAGADTEKLEQAIARINAMRAARHAGSASGHAVAAATAELGRIKARDPGAPVYHTIVSINDFPQRARWTVTNKDTLASITRRTGVGITSKGQFYDRGKEPGPGDPPKLALLIESDSQLSVEQAASEIKRLLIEGMQAAPENGGGAMGGGSGSGSGNGSGNGYSSSNGGGGGSRTLMITAGR
ncbi:RNA helicase [Malassezia cuniculi]|uniref:RNA helicase n=1 Tax=Malassezia cuniculi TaxID=948313 RepID=A0AAF0EUF7_9BASI|nr:RNA helicase [Malassezia cuniculi]